MTTKRSNVSNASSAFHRSEGLFVIEKKRDERKRVRDVPSASDGIHAIVPTYSYSFSLLNKQFYCLYKSKSLKMFKINIVDLDDI